MNRLNPSIPVFGPDLLRNEVEVGSFVEPKHASDLLRGYGLLVAVRSQPCVSAAWANAHMVAARS